MPRYGRDANVDCKIYVGDLPRDASEKELERSFSYYGPLKSVWVARNPPGFAFVEFDDARDAEDAVRGLDGTTLCGNRIRVEHSTGKSNSMKPWQGGGRSGGGRGPPRLRKPYDPNDRCYECGGRGHYAYDCSQNSRGRRGGGSRRSRSRSRSRSPDRRRDSSPYGRRYDRSRSRSRTRYRTRSRSGSRSPRRDRFRSRSRSRSASRGRSRSMDRKSDRGSPRKVDDM